MATVSENLAALQGAKSAIKQAITDKGVSMDGVPFVRYAEKIGEIPTGVAGGISPDNNCLKALLNLGATAGNVPAVRYDVSAAEVTEVLGEGVTDIPSFCFNGKTTLRSIVLPDTVTCVYMSAFRDALYLERITLPDSLLTIDNYAFFQTSLSELVIPDSVRNLYASTVRYCSKLKRIVVGRGLTDVRANSFIIEGGSDVTLVMRQLSVPRLMDTNAIHACIAHIVVPTSLYFAYCDATNWVDFADRIEVRYGVTNLTYNEETAEGTLEIGAEIPDGDVRDFDFVSNEKVYINEDAVPGYLYANGVVEGAGYAYTTPIGGDVSMVSFRANPYKATT